MIEPDSLRGDLFIWLSAALFLAFGAAALLLFVNASEPRQARRPWTLFHFATFMTLYGMRMIVDSAAGGTALGLSYLHADQMVSAISYLIAIPGALYVGELTTQENRWRIAWLAGVLFALAVVFITLDLTRGTFGSGRNVESVLALVFFGGSMVWMVRRFHDVKGNLGPRPAHILALGFAVLAVFIVNQNFEGLGLVPWKTNMEHIGLLFFTLTVGYVTASHVTSTQATFAAMEYELATARRIQAELLPKRGPRVRGFNVAARFLPMTAVGGDFYDYVETPNGVAVLIADAAGHGVPAALLASMVKVASAASREDAESPARALARVNRILCDTGTPGFATAAWFHLTPLTGAARYGAAGHPPMMIYRKSGGTVEQITENGLLLGAFPESPYLDRALNIEVGDRILLYTDGVMEATNSRDEEFGLARLSVALSETGAADLEGQASEILRRLAAWTGTTPQNDDITLVLAERTNQETS